MSDAYQVENVNVLDARFRHPAPPSEVLWRLAGQWPNQWTPAVTAAASSRIGRVFLGFSRLPSVRTSVGADGATTVLWTDVRFDTATLLRPVQARAINPFAAVVEVSDDHQILGERLSP